ncbi:aspartyl-phosphate phosphatase Spo0E family protein [Sporosarcina sp. G11-34]|nr:aspartyl-phosphate phosphatase Spo0E family protein [Sporosarcina sp. G11-34]
MISIAINKGLAANETIEMSKKLDRLLNQYMREGNRNQF